MYGKPSIFVKVKTKCLILKCVLSHSVMSDSLRPNGLQQRPGSSVLEDSPGKNTGVGCHALLQEIFLIQGSNPGPRIAGRFFTVWATREAYNTGVGSLSLFQGIFPTQESNRGLLHYRRILYQLSYQGSPTLKYYFRTTFPSPIKYACN